MELNPTGGLPDDFLGEGPDDGPPESEKICTTRTELEHFEDQVREHPLFVQFAQVVDDVLVSMGHDCNFCLVIHEPEEVDFTEVELQDIIDQLDCMQVDENS